MSNDHYHFEIAVAPGADVEDARDAVNRLGGVIVFDVSEVEE